MEILSEFATELQNIQRKRGKNVTLYFTVQNRGLNFSLSTEMSSTSLGSVENLGWKLVSGPEESVIKLLFGGNGPYVRQMKDVDWHL